MSEEHPEPYRSQSILRRAEMVQRSAEEINRTYPARGHSSEAYAAWQRATRQHREALDAMYPDAFWADIRRLAAGEHDAVDPALTFLEADPWCFRSGYAKELLLKLLARHQLSPRESRRLERVLLRSVDAGDRREFKRACRLAAQNKTARLREELGHRLFSGDLGVARRALLMLTTLRRPRLTAIEVDRARGIVLQGARRTGAAHRWVPAWVGELTCRFWAESWGHELVALALTDGESREPAITLLAHAPRFEPDASARAKLTKLLLLEVDHGDGDRYWALAWLLRTPELREQLEQRRHGPDEKVARRAQNVLINMGVEFDP
jgi:hypothetical protein